MSDMAQVVDNVKTFTEEKPLSEEDVNLLFDIAEGLKDAVPCTACRYCCDGCPVGLDIPVLISYYNELKLTPGSLNVGMRVEALPADKQPSACIGCGACTSICPQNIDIPQIMKDLAQQLEKIPSWAEICRQRDEAARKAKESK